MNDTIVTVVGNVADDPRRKTTQNGAVTNFRMASTARRFDAATQTYVDSGTFWVDVECWNTLGGNVSASVSKGDPVIVRGTLTTHSWDSDTGRRSKPQIKAFEVGHDLTRGRAVFRRDRSERALERTDGVDTATGELHPQADEPAQEYPSSEELRAGRDYVGEGETLTSAEDPDLSQEPANA
ncbi:single-stranded DNA-binding protein [Blastococcus capsensis]|uniref:single-stranded DNA-binding protein n=1 Tax=Blastococcus capsensis TaxID=1564163 RepID=UPI0025424C43|nr:single-stranded DNA-binding protein [Blastococcus capsensis]MDK3256699.1 single-stranded DNA-binding protein [Blastococcus capsensis]